MLESFSIGLLLQSVFAPSFAGVFAGGVRGFEFVKLIFLHSQDIASADFEGSAIVKRYEY